MPENYVLIERTELNASAASVTFANIPQTGYTDLKIVISGRSTGDNAFTTWRDVRVQFNSTTTGYSARMLSGNGSAADSPTMGADTGIIFGAAIPDSATTANTFSSAEIYIPNYTSANNKSVSFDGVTENNATQAIASLVAGLWSNTAAISTVTLTATVDSFASNSTFSLYGVAALGTTPAIAPKASGGNIIDYDGTYWIHTFLTSGTFTPQVGLTCEYLVVAGGGGGGYNGGGGGGAGGYRSSVSGESSGGGASAETPLSVVSGVPITVTVGAGGAGAPTSIGAAGTTGNNSIFSTITSAGGGFGGTLVGPIAGGNGGSGGCNNGLGTANQGRNGGTITPGSGGGASGAGGNTNTSLGGAGVTSSITGSAIGRAGGASGFASTTSVDGGGHGSTPGVANRGGGGGAWNGTGNAGAGGSGIVIIRYPIG